VGGGKRTGAWLARHALEQLPVSFTFGIPGVHVTELYDELGKSDRLRPVLVTHEGSAAFMADAVSRTSPGREIGVLVVVPAAGVTHALSGIAEAFLDGVPLLVLSGGVRTDVPVGYQLHDIDQEKLVAGVSKGFWRVTEHAQIVPTIFEAYRRAVTGTPGPVVVEIPVNLQLFQGDAGELPAFQPAALPEPPPATDALLAQAVALLADARAPGLFVGWGAVDVSSETQRIADLLGAPVATTLQGMSAFPGRHPLHTGMGFSRAAVPAAENAFKSCDCLLAIGTRFGEIPTGSFGCAVPENLIHIDIDPAVLGRNYKAKVAIEGDAQVVVPRLAGMLAARVRAADNADRRNQVTAQIAADKRAYQKEWAAHLNDRVNPWLFFDQLRKQLADDDVVVVDDGNHTFLTVELYEVGAPRSFISPTDFNCMGYCVPAAIGAKLAGPKRQVVGIVGDGAFLMTGLETLTATTEGAGVAYFVFYDGELSQISQGQEIPYNRKTCTILGALRLEGIATATGARYLPIEHNDDIAAGIAEALATAARGQPVIADVRIDYSKRTRFTAGVVKTVLKRFPLGDKFRFVGRAMLRKLTG
jgi:acetolactate synthase-1/2/3 large subunit